MEVIFLHLGSRIGHYGKILMDEVFGEDNFVNEMIWYHGGVLIAQRQDFHFLRVMFYRI